jgi:hypothetical protein
MNNDKKMPVLGKFAPSTPKNGLVQQAPQKSALETLLEGVKSGSISLADAQAQIAAQTAKAPGKLSFKVSEKGALSVYGLGRFPVTLYKEQWARLIDNLPALQEFATANDSLLKAKE